MDEQDHQLVLLENKIRKFDGNDQGLARRADQQACMGNMLPTIVKETKEVKEQIKRLKKEHKEQITILQGLFVKANLEMKQKEVEMKQIEMLLRVEKREGESIKVLEN